MDKIEDEVDELKCGWPMGEEEKEKQVERRWIGQIKGGEGRGAGSKP